MVATQELSACVVLLASCWLVTVTLQGCGSGNDDKAPTAPEPKTVKEPPVTLQEVKPEEPSKKVDAKVCPEYEQGVMVCSGDEATCKEVRENCYKLATGREELAFCALDPEAVSYSWFCQGSSNETKDCECDEDKPTKCVCKCPDLVSRCKGAYENMMVAIEEETMKPKAGCPPPDKGIMVCKGDDTTCNQMAERCYKLKTQREKLAWCQFDMEPGKIHYSWRCTGAPKDEMCKCDNDEQHCSCKCPELVDRCIAEYDKAKKEVEEQSRRPRGGKRASAFVEAKGEFNISGTQHLRGLQYSERRKAQHRVLQADSHSV
eukprot:TRINITY_DN1424_c0_g1_i4.p1 TRINITY_DN1424_c0_g1~~TRINITY_DN1424_c0_g1_i4.p1  ORF type:complete len:347 (+),score=44.34 TRINITY_DN1424_c0_g1_i4:88-1041(+)